MNNHAAPLFNTDVALWASFFRSSPHADLTYLDGAVYVNGECLALFRNNAAAMAAMSEARKQAGVK